MKIPYVPRELVAHLDLVYPDRCANPADTDREIWMKAGRRDVVVAMKQWLKEQDDTGGADKGRLPNVLPDPAAHLPEGDRGANAGPASATAARTPGSPGNRLGDNP